ncbi:MAG: hypothetical protein AB1424_10910 [Thermodesulfobacteriota bacterium]
MPEKGIIEPCLLKGEDLPGETPLYQYLSIEKFLYLRVWKRVTFSRITSWLDAYEGFRFDYFNKFLSVPEFADNKNDDFFGSCWSLQNEDICLFVDSREYEAALEELKKEGSASMWEAYCRYGGVRIKTTINKLNELFATKLSECKLLRRGKVYYEPKEIYNTIEGISTFFAKPISFRHESEYRYILLPNKPKDEKLIYFEIGDLFHLIDEILVAPATKANKWISRTLYNIGVGISIAPHREENVKNGKQFCRISQLYGKISEDTDHFDMV